MAVNDPPTYDAAFSAVFGILLAAVPTPTAADVSNVNAGASAFATAVDSALLTAGGAGANANRALHMERICSNFFVSKHDNPFLVGVVEGVVVGSPSAADTTASTYATVATKLAQAYRLSIAQLQ